MLNMDLPPFRPPNEANSALVRATRGCPWNRCMFCTMYTDVKFEIRPLDDVLRDIDEAARSWPGARSVFIADSDSLVRKDICEVLQHIRKKFPDAERVTSYARSRTLAALGPGKLAAIREAGLSRVHVGLESGDPVTLARMCKGSTPEIMVKGARAARAAGLEVSFYVLVGAGGPDRLLEHAVASAEVCNAAAPDHIRMRTLVIERGSRLETMAREGGFATTTPLEKLTEVRTFVEHLDGLVCEFSSDHFANHIWIAGEIAYDGVFGLLPTDRERMLAKLDAAIERVENPSGDVVDVTVLNDRGLVGHL